MLGLTLDLGSLKCVTSIVELQGQKHGRRRRYYLGFPRWQQSDVSAGTKRCSHANSVTAVTPTTNSLVKEFVECHRQLHFVVVSVFNSSLITAQNRTS